ncbi:InlB B-repeat-containing protein [Candidatus Magnetobacterium casense]|uniref:InlB B-repeat-containing protein n=1 Tax=Candidatus Magnetobacterium casense TaxID=1455061 RepID=UPI0022861361|nr:BACON domain-containing carbohydrate-binding protein [Candidatus Magnetobacterium casensis]
MSPTSNTFSSAGGSGSVSVTASAGCTWTATSKSDWIAIVGGSSGSGNGTVSYTVTANTTASIRTGTMTIADQTFTVAQEGQSSTKKVLNILKQGTGDGSIDASIGTIIWNGSSGSAEYDINTTVTLTASGDMSSDFVTWSGCDTTSSNICTVKMTVSKTVTVKFDKKASNAFMLTVTKTDTGDGSVTPSTGVLQWTGKTGTAMYSANSQVILKADAASTSKFVAWTGCSDSIGNQCTVNMTSAKSISVEFKLNNIGKKAKRDFDADGKSDAVTSIFG